MGEARSQRFVDVVQAKFGLLSKVHGYIPALTTLLLAIGLHFACAQVFGPRFRGMILIYVVTMLIAGWCGYGPGLLTAVLIVTVVPYLFTPHFTLAKTNFNTLAMLVLVSLMVSGASANLRHTERLLRGMNEDLERRVSQQTGELQQQLAELETLYGQLALGIGFLDKELRFVRVNEKLASITGVPAAVHLGRGLREILPGTLVDSLEPLCRRTLSTGEPILEYELRGPLPTDPHSQRHWLIGCSPVKTDRGAVFGLQIIVQDITDRKAIEYALQHTNEALRRANDDLGQFAYIAAHDLQEPLRTVVTFSEIVQRDCRETLEPRTQEHLRHIVAAGKRLSKLIADLLAYSRAAAEDTRLTQYVNLDQVLNSVIDGLKTRITETNARIDHDPLPVVQGDAARLEQIFQNLISNAIKYRRADQPPRIAVKANRQNGNWVFSIQDNGQGFKQDYADRIFGIFKRLHGQDVPGSGIGLAICKTVVERHGGKVWAESQPGEGSTFYFTLPSNGDHDV